MNSQGSPGIDYWLNEQGKQLLNDVRQALSDQGQDVSRAVLSLKKCQAACPPEILTQAIEITLSRSKALAQSYGDWAAEAFFSTQSLEQASHPEVAAWHAQRFAGLESVLEICTGPGLDTAALAAVVQNLTTIEADPRLAEYARHNLSLQGISNVTVVCDTAENYLRSKGIEGISAIWADPSRRKSDGQRVKDIYEYSPSFRIFEELPVDLPIGVKVNPVSDTQQLGQTWKREYIGHHWECKEQLLWRGFNSDIPGVSIIDTAESMQTAESFAICEGVNEIKAGEYLLDFHPALRAGSGMQELCSARGFAPLGQESLYAVSSSAPAKSGFYKIFHCLGVSALKAKAVKAALQEINRPARLEVKKLGLPQSAEMLRKDLEIGKLSKSSSDLLYLFCMPVDKKPLCLICCMGEA